MRRVFFTTYTPSIKADGTINALGTVAFDAAGTSTDKNTFSNYSLTATNSNPVTLDSAGKADIYLLENGLYDVTILDASGSAVDTHSFLGADLSPSSADLQENMLSNPSFENAGTPPEAVKNWTETDPGALITRDIADQSHGAASLKFTLSQNSEEFVTSDAFAVEELLDLLIDFDIIANNATANPKIDINWLDKDQSSISTATLYSGDLGTTETSWTRKVAFSATPPATTAHGKLIVYGNAHATQFTTQFDNLKLYQLTSTLAGAYPGQAVRSQFTFSSVTAITISAGSYHHAGTVDQTLTWNSLITFTAGSGGSNGDSTNLGASEQHHFYIDDSKVVTLGTNILTASEFINSTTAPTWSESKHGWYNGSDRCIFGFRTDGSNQILEFFHEKEMVVYATDIEDLAATNLADASFTPVTLSIPKFAIRAQIYAESSATPGWHWETTGQVDGTGHTLISNQEKDNITAIITDGSQSVGFKPDAAGAETLKIDTQGWYFGRGI